MQYIGTNGNLGENSLVLCVATYRSSSAFSINSTTHLFCIFGRISALPYAYILYDNRQEGFYVKELVEARAVELGEYIIEGQATVRKAAKKFGISKS